MEKIELTIFPDREIKQQGDLFGVFFEDLNHAADGGLYGELIRNRSFEFDTIDNPQYNHMTAWETVERGTSIVQPHIEIVDPLNEQNRYYLRVEVITQGEGGGIRNLGYGPGIAIEQDKSYRFSCYYRRRSQESSPVIVRLESSDGKTVYAETSWEPKEKEWSRFECEISATGTDFKGRLALLMDKPVTIDFDMISLFPKETFLNRKNGLRKDIAEMLKDMKPSFMRFPGGCLVHIGSLNKEDRNSIYRWKNTIGPVEKRPSRRNSWNYNQTLGLGYFEYFQFCEDIEAEPLPVIAAGYDPHFLRAVPLDQMHEWIDEALDLIEFANGDVSTTWGAIRAEMGHPDSFHLKYLGIGNEEVGDEFFERYEIILEAVKEKYPDIRVIGSAGPATSGSEFEKGWSQARRTLTDYVDEHFYQCPEWFIANAERYMKYPDKGPKAFLGEYASHGNTWFNALAEAVFMIGMEKAPALGLACYAPMLCNVDYSNWAINMLYYDNHRVYGSANYYIQKLFMRNQGKALLETKDNIVKREKTEPALNGILAMSTENAQVRIKDFVITDMDTGNVIEIPQFLLSSEHKYHECADISGKNYTVAFTFEKKNGQLSGNLGGRYSFAIEFARQDKDNKLRWTVDGWERLTSLHTICKGHPSDMGLHMFESEPDKEYKGVLVVEGNKITTFIDDVKYCENYFQSTEPEALYYSAVHDDDIIIKVANAEEAPKEIILEIKDCDASEAVLYCIEDIELDAKNSFEEPQKIAPQKKIIPIINNKIQYSMKGCSFGVFRVKHNYNVEE